MKELSVPSTSTVRIWSEEEITRIKTDHRVFVQSESESYSDFYGKVLVIQDIPYFFPTTYHPSTTLADYRLYEKTSRYLIEYICYGFSTYWQAHPEITNENAEAHIDQFAYSFCKVLGIERDVDYIQAAKTVQRELTSYNAFFRGDALNVTNEYTRKKLVYVLLNEFHTQKERLKRYHSERFMRHYYTHSWDCLAFPHHIILTGESTFLTYADHRTDTIQHGSTHINPTALEPYVLFLMEPILGISTWLMQPIRSDQENFLRECFIRHHHWTSTQVNVFPQDEEWEGENAFHQIIWKNEHEYDFHPDPADPDGDVPLLSIFHISEGKALVQVMLPMNSS